MKIHFIIIFLLLALQSLPQQTIKGKVFSEGKPVIAASFFIQPGRQTVHTDSLGEFRFMATAGKYLLRISAVGFQNLQKEIRVNNDSFQFSIDLTEQQNELTEVVVTG